MKKKIILIASWVCVALSMILIFFFSAQNVEKSSQTSTKVVEDVLEVVMPKEEITPKVIKKYQFPIRKIAHFGIYMLLGFCLANAFFQTINSRWYISFPCAFVCAVLYAISDEWHQGFIDGRGPSAVDVTIDSCGALTGVLIFAGFIAIYLKVNKYLKYKRE